MPYIVVSAEGSDFTVTVVCGSRKVFIFKWDLVYKSLGTPALEKSCERQSIMYVGATFQIRYGFLQNITKFTISKNATLYCNKKKSRVLRSCNIELEQCHKRFSTITIRSCNNQHSSSGLRQIVNSLK